MYETEATWVWIVAYSAIIVSAIASLYAIMTKRIVGWSWLHLFFILSVFVTFLFHAVGRQEHRTEFEWLMLEFREGSAWAIYVLAGYAYTLGWWVRFVAAMRRR